MSAKNLRKTPREHFEELSQSINNKLRRSGGNKIDFYNAILYLIKQKYKLKNTDMPPIMKKLNEMTMQEYTGINGVIPEETEGTLEPEET